MNQPKKENFPSISDMGCFRVMQNQVQFLYTCTISRNLKKCVGWETYKELTDKAADQIEQVVKDDTLVIDEVLRKIESREKEIKFASFVKSRNKRKKDGNKPEEIKDKGILREQSKQIEDRINTIKGACSNLENHL